MNPLQAVVLGLVQGITEFLPISSSAHLVLTSYFLGWEDQGLHFDIATHLGSLVAVMLYFRSDLLRLAGGVFGRAPAPVGEADPDSDRRLAWILVVATLPVAVAGLLLQDFVSTAGRLPLLIAATSIVFGVLLGWSGRAGAGTLGLTDLGWRAGWMIGLAQAAALIPGVSRSGVTLTAALFLGFAREPAARFSFLLAIPVSLLVGAKQGLDLFSGPAPVAGMDLAMMLVGFATAAVSAYLAIGWLLAWLRRRDLTAFMIYRILLGLVILGAALK